MSVIDADHDSAIAKIKLNVSVSGLWHTHSRNLMDVLENPDNIQQEDTLSIISPAKNVIYCNFIPDNDDKPTIELSKLYITSKEIEKIYEHTISSRPLEYSEAAMNSYNEKPLMSHQHRHKISCCSSSLTISFNPTPPLTAIY